MGSKIEGDLSILGRLIPKFFTPPAGCINDAAIPSSEQIDATKLEHQHKGFYAQTSGVTTTTVTQTIHVARFAGYVDSLFAGNLAICAGAATITVDLKKNGTTVLTAVLTLNSANTNGADVAATIDPAQEAYVAGDRFDLVVTATAGGGTVGSGFSAEARFNEGSQ